MATVATVGACNKFLDMEPMTQISPEAYYNTESQLNAIVLRVYQSTVSGINYWADNNTDDMAGRTGAASKYTGDLYKTALGDGNWTFDDIYHINFFFEQVLPKYEAKEISGSDANIRAYIGEMYFLRAMQYFSKYSEFGDFPIVRTTLPDRIEELREASVRAPRNEVARFILSDLDSAMFYMGSYKPEATRATSDVCMLLKSRVALFEGSWLQNFKGTAFVPGGPGWPGGSYNYPSGSIDQEIQYFLKEAMTAAKSVGDKYISKLAVNNGHVTQGPNDPVENDYLNMFATVNNEWSKYPEMLMWKDYELGIFENAVAQNASRSGDCVGPTRGLAQAFLLQNGDPIYVHGDYTNGDGYYQGDYNLDRVKANRDYRMSVFFKSPGQRNIWVNMDDASGTEIDNEYEPVPYVTDGVSRSYSTGYSIRYGCTRDRRSYGNIHSFVDLPVFVASEALINYIEACYLANGSIDATADTYWKKLRSRSGVSEDYNSTISKTDMTEEAKYDWAAYTAGQIVDPTLYNIRRERRCELMAKGFRNNDLRRWRAMDQLIKTPYHIEGFHFWNTEIETWYAVPDGGHIFVPICDGTSKANMSSPERSEYLRPFERTSSQVGYNGLTWRMAHYLSPVGINQLMLCSESGTDADNSLLWQNPYWPTSAGLSATQ